MSDDSDFECLMVDGSIVRVHQTGAAQKVQNNETMDKSRGGLSTKIHASVDALGNPVRLRLTVAQTSEYTQAEALIDGLNVDCVLADKGYGPDQFVGSIIAQKATPVLPSKRNRVEQRFMIKPYTNSLGDSSKKLKNYRRIATTRYERLATTYQSMLSLVACI